MATALLKLTDVQLGVSGTATNNFTIYQPATPDGTLRIGNGNSGAATDVMSFASTGFVGIGTAAPTRVLDVVKSSNGLQAIRMLNDNAGGSAQAHVRLENGTSATVLSQTGTGFTPSGMFNTDGSFLYASGAGGLSLVVGSAQPLYFGTNNTERMRIDSSGNVGIGETTPASYGHLAVANNNGGIPVANVRQLQSSLSNGIYTLNVDSSAHTSNVSAAGAFNVSVNSGNALTVTGLGRVGVGTTSPRGCFDVLGTGSASAGNWAYVTGGNVGASTPSASLDAGIALGRNYSNGNSETNVVWGQTIGSAQYLSISKWTGSVVTEQLRLDPSGNLMLIASGNLLMGGFTDVISGYNSYITTIANGSGKYGITIKNISATTSTYLSFLNSSATAAGSIVQTASTTVQYNTSSDYRLKENIQPMTGALEKIAQLKPVTYTWKEDKTPGQGFIAHELQAVVPDCVNGEKDAVDENGNPKYQGIDTSFLVATLTAAIQELEARVKQLEAK